MGEENSSTGKYKDGRKLKELITECESKGFTVTFVGTEGDVFNVVRELGIHMSNTHSHLNTPESISSSYMMRTSSMVNYTANVASGQSVNKGFFQKED